VHRVGYVYIQFTNGPNSSQQTTSYPIMPLWN